MSDTFTLMKDYEVYLKEGYTGDLGLFGEWLKQKYTNQPLDYISKEDSVNEVGSGIIASYMIGGTSSYFDLWIKLAFSDIPVSGIMDFGILKQVEMRKNPAKKDVISEAIAERTSCVEAMKRLVKNGILKEETDPEDKRVRRVSLTEEGIKLMAVIDHKMINLGKLLMGTLSETEMRSLIPPLKKLLGYYENLYRTKDKAEIKRLFGI